MRLACAGRDGGVRRPTGGGRERRTWAGWEHDDKQNGDGGGSGEATVAVVVVVIDTADSANPFCENDSGDRTQEDDGADDGGDAVVKVVERITGCVAMLTPM